MKISTRRLAVSRACCWRWTFFFVRVLALNTPVMKIGLGFAAIAFCAMAYGPWWAALVSARWATFSAACFPHGGIFPGFTLTAALTGLIFGLVLYKRRPCARRCRGAQLCWCPTFANSALIAFYFRHGVYRAAGNTRRAACRDAARAVRGDISPRPGKARARYSR